jgi:TolB protein
VTNLTDTSTTEWGARWSPDGTQIVFSSLSGGTVNIYLMNSDGSNRRSVLQNDLNTLHPAWSADGNKIVFTAAQDEIRQLFIVNTDGSQMRTLTTGVGDKQSPVWRPGVR